MSKAPNNNWWRGGVIYQIYPRSFADSNGDGVGDLRGITERLDYVAALGVDGIWLSPFFKSPMKDYGYDVSDYCDVDPLFGTLDDFRALVDKAHRLGLKVMIDQVLSHCSDQHPWFVESRASHTNPKADWFIWADAKDDGTPPNNWLSIFGGSAWQWDTRRQQYYMHNFLTSQPDLNFHNPEVQQALLDSVKFWLDIGVDGYRLDTANFYFHDQELRDNPPRGRPQVEDPAIAASNPYGWQRHVYDKSRPENLVFLRRLRALLDQYPHTTMVGEIGDDDGLARVAEYTSGNELLHMAYCFDLLGSQHHAEHFHHVISRFEAVAPNGWPCWAFSNHDVVRVASRWSSAAQYPHMLRTMAAVQMSLRGSVCLYQGEELGLPEVDLAYEDLRDPLGITMWPEVRSRDGCRTPMAWDSTAVDLGFSSATTGANNPAKPWLPVGQAHRALAVSVQQGQTDSLLHYYQQLLRWRKQHPALTSGTLHVLPAHPQVLAYVREHAAADGHTQRVLCVFNLSPEAVRWTPPADVAAAFATGQWITGCGLPEADAGAVQVDGGMDGGTWTLAPWAGVFRRG